MKKNKLCHIITTISFLLFVILIYFLIYYFGFKKDIERNNYIKDIDSSVQTYNVTINDKYTKSIDDSSATYYKKTFYFKINDINYSLERDESINSTSQRTIYYDSNNYSKFILDTEYNLIKSNFNFKGHIIITIFFTSIIIIFIISGIRKK